MEVTLLDHTSLINTIKAIRTCWDSFNKMDSFCYTDNSKIRFDSIGENDIDLIKRVAVKNSHESTIEHLVFNFSIKGISRGCLQELARHRLASFSVQSSRYVLKKLIKDVELFRVDDLETLEEYFYIDSIRDNLTALTELVSSANNLLNLAKTGIANDELKYVLPESFRTDLIFTINARSLRNLLNLRTSRRALPEIRKLALCLFNSIPVAYKFLFLDKVNQMYLLTNVVLHDASLDKTESFSLETILQFSCLYLDYTCFGKLGKYGNDDRSCIDILKDIIQNLIQLVLPNKKITVSESIKRMKYLHNMKEDGIDADFLKITVSTDKTIMLTLSYLMESSIYGNKVLNSIYNSKDSEFKSILDSKITEEWYSLNLLVETIQSVLASTDFIKEYKPGKTLGGVLKDLKIDLTELDKGNVSINMITIKEKNYRFKKGSYVLDINGNKYNINIQ